MIIVQIGTNDGNDHVRQLCKSINADRILLVEPFNIHNSAIIKNYEGIKNYTIFNCAIVPKDDIKKVDMYYCIEDGPTGHPNKKFEVTSMIPQHLIKHGYKTQSLKKFEVHAISINNFLKQNNCSVIDYLFLDIEGIDKEVLESIDFNSFDIKRIQIERLHLDEKWLISFMQHRGYVSRKSLDHYNYDILFEKQH